MSAINYDNVKDQLLAAGLRVDLLIVSEKVQRVPCDNDTGRQRTGWYIIHEFVTENNELLFTGAYGNWRNQAVHKISLKGHILSKEELKNLRDKVAKDKKHANNVRKKGYAIAAEKANNVWEACDFCNANDLPKYLLKKGVMSHGLKISPKGATIIPLQDVNGRISGLQVIYEDKAIIKRKGRDRDFWPYGLDVIGKYFQIGIPSWIMLIAEGYATAASAHEASGLPVAVAFNAGNIINVAEEIRKRYKNIKILIIADDDYQTVIGGKLVNVGINKASLAALAVDGKWIIPRFTNRKEKNLTDFNDLHKAEGLTPVRVLIEDAIAGAGWSASPTSLAVTKTEGGGWLKSILTIEEANNRFSIIFGSKGSIFDEQERLLVPKQDVLDLLPDRAWSEWKGREDRRVVRVDQVGFDPTENDSQILCNLWGGWPTKPEEGKCDRILSVLEFLCSKENKKIELYQWVIKWLAYPIQNPGAKMTTSCVFHGGQGAGKNLFFEAYKAIYGEYGRVVDQSAIEDQHNAWMSKKLFLIADEVVARNEMYHIKNKLKGMITGSTIRINPKHVSDYDEANHVNIVFLSNEDQPVVVEKDDRRFVVFRTPPIMPKHYYNEVGEEIEKGGIAALHDFMLKVDLTNFHPYSQAPATGAKDALIMLGLESTERFLMDWQAGDLIVPVVPCKSMDLYKCYQKWCKDNGVRMPRESNQFLGKFNGMQDYSLDRVRVFNTLFLEGKSIPSRVIIPSEIYIESNNQRKNDESKSHWVTRSVILFQEKQKNNAEYDL